MVGIRRIPSDTPLRKISLPLQHCNSPAHDEEDDGEEAEVEAEPEAEQRVADLPVAHRLQRTVLLRVGQVRLVGRDDGLQDEHRDVVGVLEARTQTTRDRSLFNPLTL